jgi:dynein heavy chain
MAEEEEKIASTSATKEEKVEASLEEEVEVVDSEGLDDSEEDKAETEAEVAPVEEETLSEDDADALFKWMKERLSLPGLTDDHFGREHRLKFLEFASHPEERRCVAYLDKENKLVFDTTGIPKFQNDETLGYFIRRSDESVTSANADKLMQYGRFSGEPLEVLMRSLKGMFVPTFLKSTHWPASVRKDFSAQIQKFMATLTDRTYQSQGKTVLYIPVEEFANAKEAAQDKDLSQRLESIVIHWTRQIKEVVNNQNMIQQAETSGPSDEIDFWANRTVDLSGISEQLVRRGVQRIVEVLQVAKSSYLAPFQTLSKSIQQGTAEAKDNLKFLKTLESPCRALSKADPKHIPPILKEMLNLIRMIWMLSRFYNTEDRLTGLLRKLSNEVMNRCRAKISLNDVFDGDVDAAILTLQESIECWEQWHNLYDITAKAIERNISDKSKHWHLDLNRIFAQIDAFAQRCRDLLEVCQGQLQFTRKNPDGSKNPLPVFGGNQGPEIKKSILTNEDRFTKLLKRLQNVDYDILDVRSTHWHEDYSHFKGGVKDLEVMMQNVINGAFDMAPTFTSCVELLQAFHFLAKRDAIQRSVDKKTVDIVALFAKRVNNTKQHFEHLKEHPPLQPGEPTFGGAALWAAGLVSDIRREWSSFSNAKQIWSSNIEWKIEVDENFNTFVNIIQEYISSRYYDWMMSLQGVDQAGIQSKLEESLMCRPGKARGDATALESNFDKLILNMFSEVDAWKRFQGEHPIPYIAHDIMGQQENLRILRENVMLVVRDYNEIMEQLDPDEKNLFQEHIKRLDKRVNAGLLRFTWASKGVIEWYVKDCRKQCNQACNIVLDFKKFKLQIQKCIKRLSTLKVIDIKKNYLYEAGVFVNTQITHREAVSASMTKIYNEICENMKRLYQFFRSDPGNVQNLWIQFCEEIDDDILEALGQAVRKSLQELALTINGDSKNDPQPIFGVNIVLQGDRVELKPSMLDLTAEIKEICKDMITTTSIVPRVASEWDEDSDTRSFYDILSNDEDNLKIVVTVMNGLSVIAGELQKSISYWDKYKAIWELDKDQFIRRYAKQNRPLEQYDTDIQRYKDLQDDIQGEELNTAISFVMLDCALLKSTLVEHCNQWQNKLIGLLNSIAFSDLEGLHNKWKADKITLSTKPLDLAELASAIQLLRNSEQNAKETVASFEQIDNKYATLKKFDVQIPESEEALVTSLRGEWVKFKGTMASAETMLQNSKNNMQLDVENELDTRVQESINFKKDANAKLPFTDEMSPADSIGRITEYKEKLQAERARQDKLKAGLSIFNLEEPEYKEISDIERDMGVLKDIWEVAVDWEAKWDAWKAGVFRTLETPQMETQAAIFLKRIGKLARTVKSLTRIGGWKCLDAIKNRVIQFQNTMPLIQDLKNPVIRDRHWVELKSEINKDFNATSDDFTLEKVFTLGLHMHSEFIATMSSNANKEAAIEAALKEIVTVWGEMEIDMMGFKDIYYKIRSTEDLYTQLEDNQVQLSTMKASRFYMTFEKEILYWEHALAHISEVIEMLLGVQRAWMYLESIFMSSEDIRKQLPAEAVLFDQVNEDYKTITQGIVNNPNAVEATCREGTLESLTAMDEKLAKIQKSLDQYLETKRQFFPRFYFLSNDDLLEILGQQKDPEQVQKHIKKCFVGVNLMQLIQPGVAGNRTIEAMGLVSGDGESIPLVNNVVIDGPVERWLVKLEEAMFVAVKKQMMGTNANFRGNKDKWVKDWPGQLLITQGKVIFTRDCTKALESMEKGNKKALKSVKKKQVHYIAKLADMVRGQLTKIDRKKVVALITMEIHSRDVEERMIKQGASHPEDFLWLSQLRFYYNKDSGEEGFGEVGARQTNTIQIFGYEYQGNNGRLVVTALTDRCIVTLTTALYLQRGGSPLGPAGTGKTETVKDLGKNLAKYVVVFNCSDSMDYRSVGRMFSGLVQTGGWGCFDEFNRIQIEVLSVIGQQVMSIMMAIRARKTEFSFMGVMIACNWNCGIFITMNPGYAGRTELPDSLKAMFRPCAMMVPDMGQIAEVMLAAQGFNDARSLGKRATTLYDLMTQQLSKQDHYDFGLRAIASVLACAGALKREDGAVSEDLILLRALRDMNVPKFIKADTHLFLLLLGDLFPGLELPVTDYGAMQVALERELDRMGLQKHPVIIKKAIQLYETQVTRHCNMLVGFTLGGKSTTWRLLAAARIALNKEDKLKQYLPVRPYCLNPKSLSLNELYGAYDLSTMEWADGVLSTIFRMCATDEKPIDKWIVLDGPVDTLWIESMNTVMDNNKQLTLINGDRIKMSDYMSLVFEVQDLSVASPATVSRAGMVYVDILDLGWQPYVTSWLRKLFKNEAEHKIMEVFFEKYMGALLRFKLRFVSELIGQRDFALVIAFCTLFEAFYKDEDNNMDVPGNDLPEGHSSYIEKWFQYCLVWSIGATADEGGRIKIDNCFRDMDSTFPPQRTVYDYFVDVERKEFRLWDDKVPQNRRPPPNAEFFQIYVPTLDTVRNMAIVNKLVSVKQAVCLVGNTGCGKTVLAEKILETLPSSHGSLVVNFSSATTSNSAQAIIEGSMEKRSKDKYGPPGGKQLVCFVDDFNMPRKDEFGSQPPLEILRQWIDYGGWYDRLKCQWRFILDMQLVVAMGPPGGGRSVISERLQSRLSMINFTAAADEQVRQIFESILTPKLAEYGEDIKPLTKNFIAATVLVYNKMLDDFLPTPAKCHYLFNMRDIAKVVQGMCYADSNFIDTKEGIIRLWTHETYRVFGDRLVDFSDLGKFGTIMQGMLETQFDSKWDDLMSALVEPHIGPVFVDFLTEPVGDGPSPYEEVIDINALKALVDEKLEDYNMEPGYIPMDLVIFRDALLHITRISRVIAQPRGNALLVGVGGSGRQSLTRLGSFISGFKVFQIEITKTYRSLEFHEDIKKMYVQAGVENQPTVFLFTDTQVKETSFLEDINNILSSGVVPNLFPEEEKAPIYDGVRTAAVKDGCPETGPELWAYFMRRVRHNLHIVLCMSPIGDAFRNRCRMYPAFVSCTTVDFFFPWPAAALKEVALKFLEATDIKDDTFKPKLAAMFAMAHEDTAEASTRMLAQWRRNIYITPTSYLELVKGYRDLLEEKRVELKGRRDRLAGGTAKLVEGAEQVEIMSVELAKKKVVVAQSQKDCEELLVVIVQEKRAADDKQKKVEADSARISVEAAEANAIAASAERDLGVALPALQQAMIEVDKLEKSSISEIKSFATPPDAVIMVLGACMVLFKMKTDWKTAKGKISEPDFLNQVKTYDKDNIPKSTLNKIRKYCNKPEFQYEAVKKKSVAAAALCIWVRAMETYATVAMEVAPKRAKLKAAMKGLAKSEAALAEAKAKLAEVIAQVQELQDRYDTSVGEKNRLRDEAESLEMKLDRADKLVGGLAGERERWEISVGQFDISIENVIGDAMIAAAFGSYCGPFDSDYRIDLVSRWQKNVKSQALPHTPSFSFSDFLAKPTDVRDWNIQGLPQDSFSTENGVIVTRGRRWALMIDPQGQANRWIKNMEGGQLKVCDLLMPDFLRELENAIQFGFAYLMQDVLETLDPSLAPVLGKAVIKVGNREILKLGDKELDYDKNFKFYMTTKLQNPHYSPEISTKVTIINFCVKEEGLEAQLLGIVVQEEQPKLEVQKSELVLRVAAGKKKLTELEDEILHLLSSAQGSLLDDANLVDVLQVSKTTSIEVTEQLEIAEETEQQIDLARQGYRPISVRAALLYFILSDLAAVDPMYQFSLPSYVALFLTSIERSRDKTGVKPELSIRLREMIDYHTLAVYKTTCLGLFERHKILLSFQMCTKIMLKDKKIPAVEFAALLSGAKVLDRSDQRNNPSPDWIPITLWDSVCELAKLEVFEGFEIAFEEKLEAWKAFFMDSAPETLPFPGEWDNKLNELQRLLVVRYIRPDRALLMCAKFVSTNMGAEFTEPPPFDMNMVFESSSTRTPLIFILSPGVDPQNQIQVLADNLELDLESVALGQGQAPIATRMIEDGITHGGFKYLANCHLSISWMPALEKLIDNFVSNVVPHDDFRLWLSSSPHPDFPISILQGGIKMTTEPPQGLQTNLARLYRLVAEEDFEACQEAVKPKYKKLLFSLVWFHALILERRKFKALGWNIPYEFNNSDFQICESILRIYIDEYPEKTPFAALRYLIAEANYGGRVTDSWDRRLLNVYISQFFCEDAISIKRFPVSELAEYYIPENGDKTHYMQYIDKLPKSDAPMAFGQHSNAEVSSNQVTVKEFFATCLALQPATASTAGEGPDEMVLRLAGELEAQMAAPFDLLIIEEGLEGREDPDPLKTTLMQELERYNGLITAVTKQLNDVQLGVQGFVVITTELEAVCTSLLQATVPDTWAFCYPSLKGLGSWMNDLKQRLDQMKKWAKDKMPTAFWLTGFTYPTGFLTALLQTTARKNGVSIDSIAFEFPILNQQPETITALPKEGAYIYGLYIEGAKWDFENGHLADADPMKLVSNMPIVHFKPSESKRKSKGLYSCPVYLYPIRTGSRERPSFMVAVDLKVGSYDATFWIKKGTAMLLSTAE